MTGYPAYPAKVCAFPVEWKIPDRQINKTSLAIQAWARRPGPAYLTALNNFAWVKECIIRVLREPNVITPIVLGLTGLLIIVRNRNVYTSLPRSLWLVFLPHVVAILFFILSVPNPKFAEASIWALGAGLLALAISRLNGETIMLVCLASSAVMSANLVNPVDVCHEWINYTGSLRTCPMEVKVTDSGLNLYVPVAGDQCWNAPLPNTPYFNPKLRLRVKDDIRSGFVLSE